MVEHNLIIETANKITNKQGKSVVLDFFTNFTSFNNDRGLSLDVKTKDHVNRNTGDKVYSLHEVTQLG